MQTMTIARRFRGPPNSGNGGYVCGMLARHIPGAAEVRLNAPAPLETGLSVIEVGAGQWELRQGAATIAIVTYPRAVLISWTISRNPGQSHDPRRYPAGVTPTMRLK